ncbi:hypothetical protein K443DRAFT_686723, partial [Laccaria amethystina LaAM-08-1]
KLGERWVRGRHTITLTMFSSQLASISSCLSPLDLCPHFGVHRLVLRFSVAFTVGSLFSPYTVRLL